MKRNVKVYITKTYEIHNVILILFSLTGESVVWSCDFYCQYGGKTSESVFFVTLFHFIFLLFVCLLFFLNFFAGRYMYRRLVPIWDSAGFFPIFRVSGPGWILIWPFVRGFKLLRRLCFLPSDIWKWLDVLVFSNENEKQQALSHKSSFICLLPMGFWLIVSFTIKVLFACILDLWCCCCW